jgi:hypothetical protein
MRSDPPDPPRPALRELVVAFFVLGAIWLSWPFLTIFNHARALFGIPLLVFYLFAVWTAMIGATFWITRRLDRTP